MKRILFAFSALIIALPSLAQTEFSLYRLNGNLAQANMINPAFASNNKVVIGLPVISSIYASFDNDGISFQDLFSNSESSDSLEVDTLSMFSKLRDTNRIKFKQSIQLFYFGFRTKRSYISFGIHQVSETRFNYPGDLVGWAIRGPGSSHYAGKPLDFGNFYGRSIAYNQVSVNFARDITPRLRVGARFNYLMGIAAGETTELNGKLTMSIDSVNINTGNVLVQTAGIDFFNQDDLSVSDYTSYFLSSKNKGMAWDFGATYNVTDRLMFSAAVSDLGSISWKDYTRAYQVDAVNYTFKGFDVLDYLNQSPGDQFLQAEADSLENLFRGTESTGGKFKTSLIGKLYAGVNYRILKVNNFSALVYFDLFQKRIDPAVSLGYNLQLGRLLNATVGLTYQNRQISNIGAGLALKLTHIQIYATSDRANSFVYPARAGRADAHIGMNLVFGRTKKKDKIEKQDEEKKEEEKKEEPKIEEPKPEEPKPDSVTEVQQPVREEVVAETPTQPVTIPEVIKEEPPVVVPEIKKEEPVAVTPTPRHEIVKKGRHSDELVVSHYVIVGAFRFKENAVRYSQMLKDAGFDNDLGYVSEKRVFYVHVHKSADLEDTRRIRDQFRQLSRFEFPESWVLTVEE